MNPSDCSLSYFICDRGGYTGQNLVDFSCMPRPANGLAFIMSGEGVFESEDGAHRLTPGDLVFTPQNSTYRQHLDPGHPIRYISCRFLFRIPPPPLSGRRIFVQRLSGFADTFPDFEWILENWQKSDALIGTLARFFGLLERTLPHLDGAPIPPADPVIAPAIAYLDENCADSIRVAELAALCHLSEPHFFARFKKAAGCSPIEYKHRAMILKARLLLTDEPDRTVESVAEAAGFASVSYFRRIFVQVVGIPPGQYRECGRHLP